MLAHYRLVEKIGEGGMGVVWRATDTILDRDVAIKLLPDEVARNPERLARFEREARTLASLDHPNIVTIHSVEEADGHRFLTMELVRGKTLAGMISRQALPLDEFFRIATALADAVNAAHDRGVTHRDLKPANVMIGDDGRVRVLDFGLAKLRDPRSDAGAPVETTLTTTRPGHVVGTVPYMSPEQVQGKPVDHRTDVFSLGVVMYQMATGERPFEGESQADRIASILTRVPPAVDDVRSDLPHHLGRIVRLCLEKDPSRRYQSALDVRNELADLERELSTASITTEARAQVATERRRGRRNLAIAVTALALVAAAVLLGLLSPRWWRDPPTDARTRIVVLPFENLGPPEDAYFADGVTQEITGRLAAVGSLGVISRKSALQYAATDKTMPEIGDELDVAYVLGGTVRWTQGDDGESRVRIMPELIRVSDDTHVWADSYDRVLRDTVRVQSEIALQVVEELGVNLLDRERPVLEERLTDDTGAYQAYLRGLYFETRPHFTWDNRKEAIAGYQRAVELDPDFAVAWARLAAAHGSMYFFRADLSPERLAAARSAAERALALAPESPRVRLALGHYYLLAQRDSEGALREFEIAEQGLPGSVELFVAKAFVYEVQGRWEEKLAALREAARLSPREADVITRLGLTLWCVREYPEAIETFDRSIALAPDQMWPYVGKTLCYWSWTGPVPEAKTALRGAPDQDASWVRWSWFWAEMFDGRYREALAGLDSETEGWIRHKMFSRPNALLAAFAHDALGETEQARRAYEIAARQLEEAMEEQPDDPRLHSSLGIAWAALGRRDEAVREGLRGVELLPISRDAFYGQSHTFDLAHVYTLVGESEEAIERLDFLLSNPSFVSARFLRNDPRWDRLRGDPAFEELLTRHEPED
jgi:non-specific serine/threonine protein kinase